MLPKVENPELKSVARGESKLILMMLDAQGLIGLCTRFAMMCSVVGEMPDRRSKTLRDLRQTLLDCVQSWSHLYNAQEYYLAEYDPALAKLMSGAFSRSRLKAFDCFVAMGKNICNAGSGEAAPGYSTSDEIVQFVSHDLTDALTAVFSTARIVAEMGGGHAAQLALTDELTGLPNRRALYEMLNRAQLADWPDGDMAVMQIDLDLFKQINDSFGHAAGDLALRHAAKAMSSNIRSEDFLARIGGDEFVIVCFGNLSDVTLANMAETIISAISTPFTYLGKNCRIGASVGIASSHESNEEPFDQFLNNADLALYTAKNAGRGIHRFFSPNLRTQYEEVEELHNQIREGLARKEFVPYFQPQVEGRSGKIIGFEALARWRHPTRGLLVPFQFLSAAADIGVLDQLDRDLMKSTLSAMADWQGKGLTIPQISMNLTATRLMEIDLVDTLLAAVQEFNVAPQDIGLEILESAMIENSSRQMIENIQNLSDAGFKVELDDFGTGHASISNLRNFKVDRIKIDRSFVKDVHLFSELSKITSAMIGLAHSLRVDALAEGVETPEERLVLNALGVDHIQGFGVARPMPAADVPKWLGDTQKDWLLPPRKSRAIAS